MKDLAERLWAQPDLAANPIARELVAVMTHPTGISSAGYPYLQRTAWERFRDWIPHLMGFGPRILAAVEQIEATLDSLSPTEDERANFARAKRVIRQVVNTAAITSPSDLWLLKHVLAALHGLGIVDRWRAGETVCSTDVNALPEEVAIDLVFLLSRGVLVKTGEGYRAADHPTIRAVLDAAGPIAADVPADLATPWSLAFLGEPLDAGLEAVLERLVSSTLEQAVGIPPRWRAGPVEIELGYRLVPMIIGLSMADGITPLLDAGQVDPQRICPGRPHLGTGVLATFGAAGLITPQHALTSVGRRVLQKGPGPFGIIEAYRQYALELARILGEGRGAVWVERSANIAASQAANAGTFRQANDALDALCADTGFRYGVFIEHAMGRGEATRQRFERSGQASIHYVGADLEDAAIDAAEAEQQAGRLPERMLFIRNADIGRPETVIDPMRAAGIEPEGAVMMVGNGLHEARAQTDDSMVEVFRAYERAGLVLLFTEASALSVDDLLQTAWNTYHAGFKYVHERSGQGLRPALPSPPSRLGDDLPQSWTECASRAGYVRLDRYCRRSRTIYPYPPANGHNPAISVNHFFMPARIAATLER